MAATASTEFLLCLSFLHLLSGWSGPGRADTNTVCYDFIITPKFRPKPHWCEVQGLVDERPFLHYDCVNHKAKASASLGKKVNVTKPWEEQTETLRDMVDFLKGQLPDIQAENLIPIEPLILQARMSCEHEAHGHGRGSWQFLFNGQTFLLFDSNNRKWTALHPGAKKVKEKWEKNRDVTMFFQKTWLEEFLMYWEQMLDPTKPPCLAQGTTHPKAMATTLIPWSHLIILLPFILAGCCGELFRVTDTVGNIGRGARGRW
ncbi:PREDICTED: NKG2D ligand 1-like, partial [Rhinopithecus bieti]|uniref:NKG2D ligand 1-like n=1 Tax=Rhinopithecus bieti TaxID=61621 RepID=UPI00083BC7CA